MESHWFKLEAKKVGQVNCVYLLQTNQSNRPRNIHRVIWCTGFVFNNQQQQQQNSEDRTRRAS